LGLVQEQGAKLEQVQQLVFLLFFQQPVLAFYYQQPMVHYVGLGQIQHAQQVLVMHQVLGSMDQTVRRLEQLGLALVRLGRRLAVSNQTLLWQRMGLSIQPREEPGKQIPLIV
jgi:hypothetical protein